jgi:hypothetical protein
MGPLLAKGASLSESAYGDATPKRVLDLSSPVNGEEKEKEEEKKKGTEKEDHATTIRRMIQLRTDRKAVEAIEKIEKELSLFSIVKNYAATELGQTEAYLWQSLLVIMSDTESAEALEHAARRDPLAKATIAVRDIKGAIAAASGRPGLSICFLIVVPTVAGCTESVARLGAAIKGATIVAHTAKGGG